MKMPPPKTDGSSKRPGLVVAVGMTKPKSGQSGQSGPSGGKMPPPGIDHPEPHDQDETSGGKATAEKALVVRDTHHCKDCLNWMGDTGECEKVEGTFSPEDACLRYFTHASESDEQEPDADEQGGPPDMDSDDQASGMSA